MTRTAEEHNDREQSVYSSLTDACNLLDDALTALRLAEEAAGEHGAEHEANEILGLVDRTLALRDATDKILAAWTRPAPQPGDDL